MEKNSAILIFFSVIKCSKTDLSESKTKILLFFFIVQSKKNFLKMLILALNICGFSLHFFPDFSILFKSSKKIFRKN